MLQRALAAITRYSMFARGARVGVAVSGGADSVCLLHVLSDLAPEWQLALTVLHLNHGLRGDESRADAAFVRNLADRLGWPSLIRETTLPPDGNLEQAARDARLAFFHDAMSGKTLEAQLDCVATGHTRSDQAETVLFRFLRGSGTAGLAGIRPATTNRVVRPLIDCTRAEILAALHARNAEWREDSTNATLLFARNRIRHELMPQLERDWNPAIAETLAQTAEWARAEESYWNSEIERLATAHIKLEHGFVFSNAPSLAALPTAVARRLIRHAIEQAKGDLRGVDFAHVEAILALASGGEGHGRLQAPGLDVLRSFEWLRFGPLGSYGDIERSFSMEVVPPSVICMPGTSLKMSLELIEKPETSRSSACVYNNEVGCLDWGSLSGRMVLRNWRPGDQYQPIGRSHPEKIKSLFQEFRIPIWERRHWPVLTDGGAIVWARRFGAAANCAAHAASGTILQIRES